MTLAVSIVNFKTESFLGKWLYFLLFSQITIHWVDICIFLEYPTVAPQSQPTRFTSPAVVWKGSACVCLISHGRSYGSHGADGHRSREPTARTSALESGKKICPIHPRVEFIRFCSNYFWMLELMSTTRAADAIWGALQWLWHSCRELKELFHHRDALSSVWPAPVFGTLLCFPERPTSSSRPKLLQTSCHFSGREEEEERCGQADSVINGNAEVKIFYVCAGCDITPKNREKACSISSNQELYN